jgi:hypothetical protein
LQQGATDEEDKPFKGSAACGLRGTYCMGIAKTNRQLLNWSFKGQSICLS